MAHQVSSPLGRNGILLEALECRLLLDAMLEDAFLDPLATSTAEPPPGYVYHAPLGDAGGAGPSVLLSDVPEYFWYRGCGPTSVAMILGYWDILGYPNYFPGDASTQTAAVNARIASAGHDADWKPTPDAPPPHHTDDSIADFFHTSRDPLPYGWSYLSYADDAFNGYSDFVGYSSANAWNENFGDFTWSDLTTEIDAGRPMMFLVDSDGDGSTDHFVPIIGYRTDPGYQYAAYTTWSNDSGVHWFDWGEMSAGDPWGIRAATYFHPSATLPDLVSSGTRVWPPSLMWGDSFTYFYNINNYGSVAAGGFRIRFYLSSNSIISSADYQLGSLYIASLGAAGSMGGGVPLSLPATPPPGFTMDDDVYIGMIVDADGNVSEGVESNNANRGDGIDRTPVHISGLADLIGTAFDLNVHMLNTGPVTASYTVQNVGDSAAGGFYVRFYLSENTYISTSDTYLGQQYISSLGAGSIYSNTITLSPGSTDPFGGDGTYTIGMVVDYDNRVVEGVETNNANRGFGLDKTEANYGVRIFYADFEHGDGAMDIINTTAWAPEDGLWHLTTTRGADPGHSGTHSMHYGRWDKVNREWDYDIGDSAGVFYTKRIELPNEPATLTFNYLCRVEASLSKDDIRAQVYDPDTGVYTTVLSKGNGLSYNTDGKWVQARADLSAFAGKNVRLRFTFNTEDAYANNYEGWYVDDIAIWAVTNATTVEGFRSLNAESRYYHEASYINWVADHDTFVFAEEQSGGTFTITTVREGSPVNPALAVYNYKTGEMLYMDSNSGSGNEARVTLVNVGYWNSYLVEVWDTEEDSVGELDVHIIGSGVSYAQTIPLDGNGGGSITGTINVDEDTDYYRVTAPPDASGNVTITLTETSGTLQTRLQVWRDDGDDKPEVIAYTGAGPETATFTDIQPGEVLQIAVADHDFNGTGNFELSVDFSTSLPATLATAEGFAWFHGTDGAIPDSLSFNAYVSVNDTDSYYFAGDSGWSGAYTVTVNRLSGNVDPVVAVYNATTGERLGFNRDYGDETTAQLSLSLSGWQKYIVAVADANRTGTGNVEILIQAPGSFAGVLVPLDANGDGIWTSDSISANDTDFYQLPAPADTDGTLKVVVTPSATLNAAIALFNGAGEQVAYTFSHGTGAAETLDLTGLTPGEPYYLTVLARDYATTGSFSVEVNWGQVVPDSFPGGHDYWTIPDVHGDWTGSFVVSDVDDWDGWMFASDRADGSVVFSVTGSGGLIPVLGLYDADTGNRLAYHANTAGAASVTLNTGIAAHKRYYLMTTGRDGTTGTARLSMDIAPMAYSTVPIDSTGHGAVAGKLTEPADTNYYMFTAPAAAAYGELTIVLTNVDPSLKGNVMLWDDTTGRWVDSAAATMSGQAVKLHIASAQANHVYCVAVTSLAYVNGAGPHNLYLDFSMRKPGDANLDGNVDLDDFVAMKNNFGTGSTWSEGDFNGDGNVDLDDFVILKNNFGRGAAPAVATVDLAMAESPSDPVDVPAPRRWRRTVQRTREGKPDRVLGGSQPVLDILALTPLARLVI